MTVDDMIYFQSLSKNATVFYAIADVEAYNDNRLTLQESSKIAVQNLADILALGLDPERAIVYKQSEEIKVMRLATIFSAAVTNNMLRSIYGERQVGLYLSALIQAGDILMPQLPEFGGPKPVIVPVGADQDPHIRLARDLANSYHKEFGFIPPSAVYHKLMKSLDGASKMSKRNPDSSISLQDTPTAAARRPGSREGEQRWKSREGSERRPTSVQSTTSISSTLQSRTNTPSASMTSATAAYDFAATARKSWPLSSKGSLRTIRRREARWSRKLRNSSRGAGRHWTRWRDERAG
jgi:tryptophanyl-tRNA synthetase